MEREVHCLAEHGGQPQRGGGTCLGLEWHGGLPEVEKEQVEGVPSTAFPKRPALRLPQRKAGKGLSTEPQWALGCTWLLENREPYHREVGFWSGVTPLCCLGQGFSLPVCALRFQFCWMEQSCKASLGQKVKPCFKKICMLFKDVNFIKYNSYVLPKFLLSQSFGITFILQNS